MNHDSPGIIQKAGGCPESDSKEFILLKYNIIFAKKITDQPICG